MTAADDDHSPLLPQEDIEGGGQSRGVPAAGTLDDGPSEPLGTPGMRHWRESTITRPDLNERGGVFFAAVVLHKLTGASGEVALQMVKDRIPESVELAPVHLAYLQSIRGNA